MRAVVAHSIPVVAGIGHEIDVTLADFAADVRAPTPSAAAEIVVPDRTEYGAALRRAADRLRAAVTSQLDQAGRNLAAERRVLDGLGPTARLAAARERAGVLLDRATAILHARLAGERGRVDQAGRLLPVVAAARVAKGRAALETAGAALVVLGPQATLDRGYAIVRRSADGTVLRHPAEAPAGERLAIRLAAGDLSATVDPVPGDGSPAAARGGGARG